MATDKSDPHPNLPREGGFVRRFKPTGNEALDKALETIPLPPLDPMLGGIVRTTFEDGEIKHETISPEDFYKSAEKPWEAELTFEPTADAPKKKRGRPVAPKPWEAEGISRMTWYRRKKKVAALAGEQAS